MSEPKIISHEVSEETQEAKVVIAIYRNEILSQYDLLLRKLQQEAKIPGFRPGKAPLLAVKTRFGKDALKETIDEFSEKQMSEAIKSLNLRVGGTIITDIEALEEGNVYHITATFPLFPEPKLTVYKGLNLNANDITITDEDVNNELKYSLQNSAKAIETEEPADANCVMRLKVTEVDKTGIPLIGKQTDERNFEFGSDLLGIGSDEQLLGIRKGESRIIQVRSKIESDIIITGKGGEKEQQNMQTFKVEAVEVFKIVLPEMNDDWARSINPNIADLEELRLHYRRKMRLYASAWSHGKLFDVMLKALVKENPFPLSHGYIRSAITDENGNYTIDKKTRKVTEDDIKAHEPGFRWYFLRELIIKEEKISKESEEFKETIQAFAEEEGMGVEEYIASKKKSKELKDIEGDIIDEMIFEVVTSNANITTRTLTWREFLNERYHEELRHKSHDKHQH